MTNLLCIDGNSLLNRAWYGSQPLTTQDGRYTNAVFNFYRMVMPYIEQYAPSYVGVAFDVKHPTFRHTMYELYKSGRHETPPQLLEQFPYTKEMLQCLGIKVLECPGYEADDILGTFARLGSMTEDTHVYLVSGDRDLLQLVTDKVSVILVGNAGVKTEYTPNLFFEKFGVPSNEYVNMKAIMGDSSDHIPGVTGIGEKGAQKLVSNFHSLDGIYENIDSDIIKKGEREKLLQYKDDAYMSLKLATIYCEVPSLTLEEISYNGVKNLAALRAFLLQMEFTSLLSKYPEKDEVIGQESSGPMSEVDLDLFQDDALVKKELLIQSTSDVSLLADENFSVYLEDQVLYFTHDNETIYRFTGNVEELKSLFENAKNLITYDVKSLLHFLDSYSIRLNEETLFDISLGFYLLFAHKKVDNPENLIAFALHENYASSVESLVGFTKVRDALATELNKDESLVKLLKLETSLSFVLFDMEKTGFCLDTSKLSEFGKRIKNLMAETEQQIIDFAGEAFNVNSTKQLGHILFEKLSIPYPKKKASSYSTNIDILTAIQNLHPIVPEILHYRQYSKLYSTYVIGLLNAVTPEDQRLHTDFKQVVTATGRLSSTEPNLQNIPVRTELGKEMRRFFVAQDEDSILIDADYSQIELRLLAHMAKDPAMISAFCEDIDIHASTASLIYGVSLDEVTPSMRKQAKTINFGILYGMSAHSLSEDLSITHGDAKKFIDAYFAAFPCVKPYLDQVIQDARILGYTKTLFGRRRVIPELLDFNKRTQASGERMAMNSPIQGTAADIIKIAMVRVSERLKREHVNAKLVMQVHDELILESKTSCAEQASKILKEEMEKAVVLSVPLKVEIAIGKDWSCKE